MWLLHKGKKKKKVWVTHYESHYDNTLLAYKMCIKEMYTQYPILWTCKLQLPTLYVEKLPNPLVRQMQIG
jgi:hypothetical protein